MPLVLYTSSPWSQREVWTTVWLFFLFFCYHLCHVNSPPLFKIHNLSKIYYLSVLACMWQPVQHLRLKAWLRYSHLLIWAHPRPYHHLEPYHLWNLTLQFTTAVLVWQISREEEGCSFVFILDGRQQIRWICSVQIFECCLPSHGYLYVVTHRGNSEVIRNWIQFPCWVLL